MSLIRAVLLIFLPLSFLLARNAYLEQAEKAFARGAYDKALELFQQAIDSGEPSGRPQFFIGQILEVRKKYRESLTYFAQAVEKPLEKNYKIAALWKLVLFYQQFQEYEACLRYLERLEAMGVKHETLEKIREQAETQLSPEKRQMRLKLAKAIKQETELRSLRKEAHFYSTYREELLEIAETYEAAAKLDVSWQPYLWNAAFYYEKLGLLDEARRLYLQLTQEEASQEREKAWYKLGVLEKKAGEYEKSLKYFSKAIESKNQLSPAMRYYLQINAAQAHFALGNFEQAIAQALPLSNFVLGKSKMYMPRIIHCLSLVKMGKSEVSCLSLAQEKENSLRSGERIPWLLLLASLARHKGNQTEAIRYYQAALLVKNTVSAEEDEEEEGVPSWLLPEVPLVFDYFATQKRPDLLLKMAQRYPDIFDNPKYHQTIGVAAYQEKNYQVALLRLKQLANPSPQEREMLRYSLLALGKFSELAQQLAQEALLSSESKEKVLAELQQKQYAEFLKTPQGQTLLQNLKNMPEPNLNTPD